jgi:hypothetical protein
MNQKKLHALLAEFEDPLQLLEAARRAREAGYRRMDAYTPMPVRGLAEVLGMHRSAVPAIVLAGGVLGGLTGFFGQLYAMAVAYPLNVGGRPRNSWPSFIPITFELTVLGGAIFGVLGMLALNKLPMPYHPVFNASRFELATREHFFLAIEAQDPLFDPVATREFLLGLGALEVADVAE